jgi:hypothetical protein
VLDADAPLSSSFSYANAGATADRAMADAKAIVMIFTFELRCLSKKSVLRARLVTQSYVTLKAPTHHKIQRFVHANVMEYPATKKELLLINRSASALRRNYNSRNAAIHEQQTCHATDACNVTSVYNFVFI